MEQNTKCHYVSLCVTEGDSKMFQDDSHVAVRPSRRKTGGESDESGDHGIPLNQLEPSIKPKISMVCNPSS